METAQRMVDAAAEAAGYTQRMYHGTPYGGFTKFREWSYFSPNKEYSDRYHNPGASSIRGRYAPASKPMTYGVYVKAENPFDTREKECRDIFKKEFYRKWGNGADLQESGLPDWTDGEDFAEFFEENDYDFDAVYLDEGADGGYGDEVVSRGFSMMVKDSAQIKSADPVTYDDNGNVIPLSERFNTENDDIRYELKDTGDAERITRDFVAGMDISAARTETERKALMAYQQEVNGLEVTRGHAAEQQAILDSVTATEDEKRAARNRLNIYNGKIERYERKINELERKGGVVDILRRATELENELLNSRNGLQDALDELTTAADQQSKAIFRKARGLEVKAFNEIRKAAGTYFEVEPMQKMINNVWTYTGSAVDIHELSALIFRRATESAIATRTGDMEKGKRIASKMWKEAAELMAEAGLRTREGIRMEILKEEAGKAGDIILSDRDVKYLAHDLGLSVGDLRALMKNVGIGVRKAKTGESSSVDTVWEALEYWPNHDDAVNSEDILSTLVDTVESAIANDNDDDISIWFSRDTIDPKINRDNHIYDSDEYNRR